MARLRLVRTLIAQSSTVVFDESGVSISNDLNPKKRNFSPAARIAAAQPKRWTEQRKPTVVTTTRVPAKEASKRRAEASCKIRNFAHCQRPDGPVAVPADKRAPNW
jgi:hypothetical protein